MKKRFTLLLVLLLTFLLPTGAMAADSAKASTMSLSGYTGTVTVTDASGKSVKVSKDLRLYSGYTIATKKDSSADIKLDNTKYVKLDASSKASLRKSGGKLEIYVVSGTIFCNVTAPLGSDESMTVRNSNSVAGIRGTSIWETVNSMGVLHGSVEATFFNRDSNVSLTTRVESGQQVTYDPDSDVSGTDPALKENDFIKTETTNDSLSTFIKGEILADSELQRVVGELPGVDVEQMREEYPQELQALREELSQKQQALDTQKLEQNGTAVSAVSGDSYDDDTSDSGSSESGGETGETGETGEVTTGETGESGETGETGENDDAVTVTSEEELAEELKANTPKIIVGKALALNQSVSVPQSVTLMIAPEVWLTLAPDLTLTNSGIIENAGAFVIGGTLVNNGTIVSQGGGLLLASETAMIQNAGVVEGRIAFAAKAETDALKNLNNDNRSLAVVAFDFAEGRPDNPDDILNIYDLRSVVVEFVEKCSEDGKPVTVSPPSEFVRLLKCDGEECSGWLLGCEPAKFPMEIGSDTASLCFTAFWGSSEEGA